MATQNLSLTDQAVQTVIESQDYRRWVAAQSTQDVQYMVRCVLGVMEHEDKANGTDYFWTLSAVAYADSVAAAGRDLGYERNQYHTFRRNWLKARDRFIYLWREFGYRVP